MDKEGSAPSEPGSNLSLSSTEYSSPLHQAITEIHDILGCLSRQLSALQDPAPHDAMINDYYEGAYSSDLSHIENKYPEANPELLRRLGNANWKRRQQLMSLRAQSEKEDEGEEDGEEAVLATLDMYDSAPSQDRDDETTSEGGVSFCSKVESTGPHAQAMGTWTNFSGNGSTLGTAITSMAGDPVPTLPDLARPVARAVVHRLRLPRPPKPNSTLEGKRFRCPYCSYELVEVMTLRTWK